MMVGLMGGCVSRVDSSAPEPIRTFVEPDRGSQYRLYRPSSYDRNYDWPLVVVCHSALGDSPRQQIRAWSQLAEREGLLVAAPSLTGVRKFFAPKPRVQRELLREDEARILSVVEHVRAGHSVSPDRVFLYGFGGGAHAALFTGLRHPDVFRAIALVGPGFEENCFQGGEMSVAPYQPILVNYNVADAITDRFGKRCVAWLQRQQGNVRVDVTGQADRHGAPRVVAFFEEVVRSTPWMNIRTNPVSDGNPLGRQFELLASPKPLTVRWTFGDGDKSSIAEPIHVYARPGSFRVTVQATFADRQSDSRSILLAVPQGTATPTASETDPTPDAP